MADKLIVTKKDHENPFQMPPDSELYTLKAREKSEKLKEKKDSYSLPIHKKSTKAVELKSYHTTLRKVRELGLEEEKVGSFNIVTPGELDPDFVLSVTKERRSEKESIAEYLAKKREIFLIEYSLGVKRKEISKLQEIAEMEEAHVKLEEENLEKNDEAFNKFVKESDQLTMESVKEAEKQTKAKLEKITELKRLQAQVVGIQSEISKLEELLGEYKLYEEFLDNLSPKEWQEKKNKRKNFKTEISTLSSHKYNAHTFSSISSDSGFSAGEEENINEDEPHLYFTAPEQVLKVLHDIEEQNLSLIQHSQETQKNLEEMEEICRKTQVKMSKETETLIDQVKVLETAIKWEEEKATELEMMAKLFSFGEYKAEDQEKMLADINKKVETVYRACIGENTANISTLMMLTSIENKLEDLLDTVDSFPQHRLEAVCKAKLREKRIKERNELEAVRRKRQEDRIKKALDRAYAVNKKKAVRKLMPRSAPPQSRGNKKEAVAKARQEEEEEIINFFT